MKDLWFAEFERLLNEKEARGIPFQVAYDQASNETDAALRERLADVADLERKRRREENL